MENETSLFRERANEPAITSEAISLKASKFVCTYKRKASLFLVVASIQDPFSKRQPKRGGECYRAIEKHFRAGRANNFYRSRAYTSYNLSIRSACENPGMCKWRKKRDRAREKEKNKSNQFIFLSASCTSRFTCALILIERERTREPGSFT